MFYYIEQLWLRPDNFKNTLKKLIHQSMSECRKYAHHASMRWINKNRITVFEKESYTQIDRVHKKSLLRIMRRKDNIILGTSTLFMCGFEFRTSLHSNTRFYKNKFNKNIEAEICKLLGLFQE